jgi:hypothetical protein
MFILRKKIKLRLVKTLELKKKGGVKVMDVIDSNIDVSEKILKKITSITNHWSKI